MKTKFIGVLTLLSFEGFSQSGDQYNPLNFSGYLETYYSYDFSRPSDHNRPGFVYSHHRHNEVNLNLGFVKANYSNENVRANFALMAGTYANSNLIEEPGVLKNILEANAGVKISKTKNLWVDAGIFSSHIGFESAIGKDCWNLTRSILADNSPYYESGVRLSYTTDNEKLIINGFVLNGWQRIQRVNENNSVALGHQVIFKPNDKTTLNSSSFIGSVTPDSNRLMRYFHNLYGQFQFNQTFGLIAGFDLGVQEKSKTSSELFVWYSPVVIAKYSLSEKVNLSARVEYYNDKDQTIIATGTQNGFQTYGYSVNFDYSISENALWRIEGRMLNSKDKIFIQDQQPDTKNYLLTSSLAISF